MQLSEKQITFCNFLAGFLKFTFNFKFFEKKMTLVPYVFPKVQTLKDLIRQMSKNPILEHPSTVNMLENPKHLSNLPESTFLRFLHDCGRNRVVKCLC